MCSDKVKAGKKRCVAAFQTEETSSYLFFFFFFFGEKVNVSKSLANTAAQLMTYPNLLLAVCFTLKSFFCVCFETARHS